MNRIPQIILLIFFLRIWLRLRLGVLEIYHITFCLAILLSTIYITNNQSGANGRKFTSSEYIYFTLSFICLLYGCLVAKVFTPIVSFIGNIMLWLMLKNCVSINGKKYLKKSLTYIVIFIYCDIFQHFVP